MRIATLMRVVIFILAILPPPGVSILGGFFIRDPTKCQLRCDSKHGFWEKSLGRLERVSDGVIILKGLKCFCKLTPDLRRLVRSRFGKGTARKFMFWVFYGYSRPTRFYLMRTDSVKPESHIQFVSHAQRGLYRRWAQEKIAKLPPGAPYAVDINTDFLKDEILKKEDAK
ncbi:unnamed protein product [Bemisia tabaci]|uniref:Uncharacterized protein n=1 Tax=Bemisia tabaci TaxID=7038 RepID=A0A9P0A1Q2_BEMTA|nr:unnamed protein product [Bemisia tabaci]